MRPNLIWRAFLLGIESTVRICASNPFALVFRLPLIQSTRLQSPMKLLFYTTAGCHLCDQALEIIGSSLRRYRYELEMVEIADSDALIDAYGTKIPVLEKQSTGDKLCWPFSAKEVRTLVKS